MGLKDSGWLERSGCLERATERAKRAWRHAEMSTTSSSEVSRIRESSQHGGVREALSRQNGFQRQLQAAPAQVRSQRQTGMLSEPMQKSILGQVGHCRKLRCAHGVGQKIMKCIHDLLHQKIFRVADFRFADSVD